MKSQLITDEEKQTIRAARKVLDKIAKRYTRLREKSGRAHYEAEEPHYKMFKELSRLKVDVNIEDGNEFKHFYYGINGENAEIIQLSLNSGMYATEEE
jgi:hypothetical protein